MDQTRKKEMIEQLKLEREILLKGGYGRSVRTPWKTPDYFRDSVTCLNFGEVVRRHPCSECFLIDYVPAEQRSEDIPCHFIQLNENGETIAELDAAKDRARAEHALLRWIDATITRLEKETGGAAEAAKG